MFDHFSRNDMIISILRRSLQQFWLGLLGGKGKGSKGVHDKVDPKELDCMERGLSCSQGGDKNSEKSIHVNGELELEETLDVVKDISTP